MQDQPLGSRYFLVSRLGGGGMGEVFLARTRDGDGPLAVKLLRGELTEDPDAIQRFMQESRLLRRLRHPNVVRVLDLVAEADRFGIVMEYVPDGDLRRAVPMPCPTGTALELLAQVAEGLAAIHAAGITHRDLKPENVLVQILPDGSLRARVTDFGVSHYTDSVSTRHNGMVGSAGYLSPESAIGLRPGPEGDVYALGVMLHELCEGRRPFVADNPWAVIRAHAESPIPRPPDMPEPIWQVMSQLLAKDPAQRPTAAAAADLLGRLAELPALPALTSRHTDAAARVGTDAFTAPTPPAEPEHDITVGESGTEPAPSGPILRRTARAARTTRRPWSHQRVTTVAAFSVLLVVLLVAELMARARSDSASQVPALSIVSPSTTPTSGPTARQTAKAKGSPSASPSTRPSKTTSTRRSPTSTPRPTTDAPEFPLPAVPSLAVFQPTADALEDSNQQAPLVIGSVDPTVGTLTSIMVLYNGAVQFIAPVAGFTGPYYWTAGGLQNGRAYRFTARVCNSYGECSSSPPVTFTPYTVPTLGALSAGATATKTAITWPQLPLNGNPRPWTCRLTADTSPHDPKAPLQLPVAVRGGTVSWAALSRSTYTAQETCTDGLRTVVGPLLTFSTP